MNILYQIMAVLCALAMLSVPLFEAQAEWKENKDGILKWTGERVNKDYKFCIEQNLTTGECFRQWWTNMGFKGKLLEELIESEKDPTARTYAACSKPLWDKPYANFIDCMWWAKTIKKNNHLNRTLREYFKQLSEGGGL